MTEALYPKEQYTQGHPNLAFNLSGLGSLLQQQREYQGALPYFQQALAMYQEQINRFADAASEAQALNFVSSIPLTRDNFLSVTRRRAQPDVADYDLIWRSKAAITRILQRRHLALLAATASPEIQSRWQELLATRRQLSRLAMNPLRNAQVHRQTQRDLTEKKEKLEGELAERLPTFGRWQELNRLGPADLVRKLPAKTVFIDLLRYVDFEQAAKVPGRKGEQWTSRYVGFVLLPGQPAQRVELGPAAPIDQAIREWRRDINEQKASPAAKTLGSLVWEPLAKHIPENTQTIWLAPDGALSRLPWPALPGRKPNTVLLEDHLLGLVPHGPALLDRLIAPRKDQSTGLLLAVGGVQYDQAPSPPSQRSEDLQGAHLAERGGRPLSWDFLTGSLHEVDQIIALAGNRQALRRSGTEASTAQLIRDLPRARWAHLATHGFFADARFRTGLQLAEEDFKRGRKGERAGQGARSPLVLSGLVLAGANLPVQEGNDHVPGDDGILSAEMIVDLPLENLELAVLSACESGLGEAGSGEGVFGLQRAFHMAGAHNVIASLWKVNDEAAAALMTLFYDKLWRENKSPLAALREAQLTLYHDPEKIPALARERAVRIESVTPGKTAKENRASGKDTVKLWAGFMLSGLGQ